MPPNNSVGVDFCEAEEATYNACMIAIRESSKCCLCRLMSSGDRP